MPSIRRPAPNEDITKAMSETGKEAKNLIERLLGDVSKTSASKQIILGASSGWITGFLSMRVGKTAALALGGGIILLQVANQQGYIRVNWDKVNKKLDKVADKVEEQITGEGPTWVDKAERFADRKLDQAGEIVKKGQKKAKRWYSGDKCQLKEMHIFVVSFVAGIAIGIGCS